MKLREDQARTVESLYALLSRGKKRVCVVAPCGAGKTVMAAHIMRDAAVKRNRNVLFLAHREELLHQASDKLTRFEVPHGVVTAGEWTDRRAPVQVASIQTLAVSSQTLPPADVIFVDECHRFDAQKIVALYPGRTVIGLTATPERLRNGRLTTLHDEYDDMVIASTPEELLRVGAVVPARIFAPPLPVDLSEAYVSEDRDYDKNIASGLMQAPAVTGDVVRHWQKAGPARTVMFTCDIAHANNQAAKFAEAGIRAEVVTGEMDRDRRSGALERFSTGETLVLLNANLLVEGWDVPAIQRVCDLAPTRSVSRFLQKLGRGQRPHPGKTHFEVYDHAGNVLIHGDVHATRNWTLNKSDSAAKKAARAVSMWRCPSCFCVAPAPGEACPFCLEPVAERGRRLRVRKGVLEEYDAEKLAAIEAERIAREAAEDAARAATHKKTQALFSVAYQRFGKQQGVCRRWVLGQLKAFERSGVPFDDFMRNLRRGDERPSQVGG